MPVPSQAAGTNTSQNYEQKIAVNLSPFSQLPLEITIYFQAQFHACLSDGYK